MKPEKALARMKLKIFLWIDGAPTMHMDLGWNWRLEDDAGNLRSENAGRFESASAARSDALALLCLDWSKVEMIVELGKFNPDEPSEWVNGEYAGPHGAA